MSGIRPYPRYRDSDVHWLGSIPDHWRIAPLWILFRRTKTLGIGSEELLSVYRDYGVIPKSSRDDNFNKASEDLSKYQIVKPGNLVINKMKAWQGSVAISEFTGIVSPAYFVFKQVADMDSRFMHYLMRSIPYFGHYASISSGVRPNQWDLDPSQHRVMPVLLPPQTDQRAIAAYLDHETDEIDQFILTQEELIALLNERRAATITRAVTGGLTTSTPTIDTGVAWIGYAPEHWRILKLARIGVQQESGVSVNGYNEPAGPDEVGVLKTGAASKGYFDPTENKRVVEEDVQRACCPLRQGWLLVNRANTPELVGSGAYISESPSNLFLSDKLWQINLESANNRFIAWWMKSPAYKSQLGFHRVGASASMQNLSFQDFKSIDIALPPFEEQSQISDYLEREVAEIDAAIMDAREVIALSRERRAALISAAVTGKIDVRNWRASKERVLESHGVA